MCSHKGKDPVQKYEDGEITLQKMFNEQDEETAIEFLQLISALLIIIIISGIGMYILK